MSYSLQEIQENIHNQLMRDYGETPYIQLENMLYAGLGEETGEVLGIAKRRIRNFAKDKKIATQEHLIEELGDVLWYLTALCDIYNIPLDEVWETNKKKLEERYG